MWCIKHSLFKLKASVYSKLQFIQNFSLFKTSVYSKLQFIQNFSLFKTSVYSKLQFIQNFIFFSDLSSWRQPFWTAAPLPRWRQRRSRPPPSEVETTFRFEASSSAGKTSLCRQSSSRRTTIHLLPSRPLHQQVDFTTTTATNEDQIKCFICKWGNTKVKSSNAVIALQKIDLLIWSTK